MKNYKKKLKKLIIYFSNCNNKRRNDVWVFTEWYGNKCGDNATYLANYVAENYPNIKPYWICKEDTDTFSLHRRIVRYIKGSDKAISVLKYAGVIVMIQGIAEFDEEGFNYCGNALKVNLWHGIMWKKLGYDLNGGLNFPKNIIVKIKHKFKRKYLFESPSEAYKKVLLNAMAISPGEIINAGQPRNSLFYDKHLVKETRKRIENRLDKKCSIKINCDTKIVTYMPTFRDYTNEIFNFEYMADNKEFIDYLENKNIIIIQKLHFISNQRGNNNTIAKIDRIISDNSLDTQDLLAATDLLVTDYSSCFFDYLLLDRPIIHFMYDYDYYINDDRGLYYGWKETVAGDAVFEKEMLFKVLKKNIEDPNGNADLRKQRISEFLEYESSGSCRIIIQEILRRLNS